MARNFKTPKPRTFRLERFHLQGQHDQSTHGGGGTGSGRTLYGKNQVVQGSPTRETTKAPSQSERDVTGPVVRQTAEGTMTARGEDWDPDFTADEDVRGKVDLDSGSLGDVYDALRTPQAKGRLMHKYRTGETIPAPDWDEDGNMVKDDWKS